MADPYGIFTVACVVAVSFTLRDILLTGEAPKAAARDQPKTMEGNAASTGPPGPTIKFQICYG